jgi:hypothetical protein
MKLVKTVVKEWVGAAVADCETDEQTRGTLMASRHCLNPVTAACVDEGHKDVEGPGVRPYLDAEIDKRLAALPVPDEGE